MRYERIWTNAHFAFYIAFMLSGQGHIHRGPGLLVGIFSAVLVGAVLGILTSQVNKKLLKTNYNAHTKYLLVAVVIILSSITFPVVQTFLSFSIYFPWQGG